MTQSGYEKMILAVLVLLALINLVFFFVTLYSGPIVGFIVPTAIVFHWWRKRDSMLIAVMSIIWILFHVYELIAMGDGSHPFFFYLNLLLPILLLFCGLKEKKRRSIRTQ